MKQQWQAFIAEIVKNRHSKIIWISFLAFSLAPVFGGVFMLMMKGSGIEGLSGAFRTKAAMMSFSADWNSLLSLLSQATGIGGLVIFGFAASWLFGREYSDGTAKDLLALPISRTKILNAKFIYYMIWCVLLVISNLILGLIIGWAVEIPGWESVVFVSNLKVYFLTTLMVILLNTPVAFMALAGRGYLAPLGFVVLSVVVAQIFGALGFGVYFPWAVPGIFSGSGGESLQMRLNLYSYLILILVSISGYVGTILWWKFSDQSK
jgi:ABC-2 type transport system permease protein